MGIIYVILHHLIHVFKFLVDQVFDPPVRSRVDHMVHTSTAHSCYQDTPGSHFCSMPFRPISMLSTNTNQTKVLVFKQTVSWNMLELWI